MTAARTPVHSVKIRPATAERWDELADLFGPSGAYANCWCTWFRQSSKDFDQGCHDHGAGNKELLRRLTDDGRVPGLLAYAGDEADGGMADGHLPGGGQPIGWVSVGPREEFGRILRSPTLKPGDPEEPDVWSIVCFWVPRAHRGRGLARALLAGAVDWAREQGARAVEGYPVDTAAGRKTAASIYTGTVSLFAGANFTPVRAAKPGTTRVVMRRALT